MKLYFTHCSAKKNPVLKNKKAKVAPDKLYTSLRIQRFIKRCKGLNVNWAIFSDKYGIWFPTEKHKWYEKHPSEVTNEEFKKLAIGIFKKLKKYNEIYFYANYKSPRFHPLYRKLFNALKKKRLKIRIISHLNNIKF